MKIPVKNVLVILGVIGAAVVLLALALGSRKKDCLGGQGKPALDACSFLVKWHPGAARSEALFKRSRLYATQQMYERELADLQAALPAMDSGALPPSVRAEAYAALALALGRKGDKAAYLKYSELAVKAGSADPGVYLSLAEAYIDAGRPGEAVALLEGASGIERKHPYYNRLAAAYGGAGDFPKAYDALKTALTVKAPRPVLAETAKHMGLVCFELKRYKEAETYLGYAQRAGADCPECPLLLTTIRDSLAAY